MNTIWPRPARSGDIAQIDEWIKTTPQNLFDPGILEYKDKIKFYCAHNGKPLLFMPVQNVLMLESLAVNPKATTLEIAQSIAILIKHLICKAEELGYNELYFISGEPSVSEYARRHGFDELLHDKEKKRSLFFWKVGAHG